MSFIVHLYLYAILYTVLFYAAIMFYVSCIRALLYYVVSVFYARSTRHNNIGCHCTRVQNIAWWSVGRSVDRALCQCNCCYCMPLAVVLLVADDDNVCNTARDSHHDDNVNLGRIIGRRQNNRDSHSFPRTWLSPCLSVCLSAVSSRDSISDRTELQNNSVPHWAVKKWTDNWFVWSVAVAWDVRIIVIHLRFVFSSDYILFICRKWAVLVYIEMCLLAAKPIYTHSAISGSTVSYYTRDCSKMRHTFSTVGWFDVDA